MVYRVGVGLCALLFAFGAASGQVYPGGGYPPGGYPGGGYPPGGYPGGGYPPGGYPGGYPGSGGGIPIPRGSKTSKPKPDSGQPLPNFRGTLKQMDSKTISLELNDNRVLDFRRTSKTKFFKNGDEVKEPKFNAGDQLSIEGPEDPDGYMSAVNVYWEKAAPGTTTTSSAPSKDSSAPSKDKDKNDGVVDTWAKDAPGSKDAPAGSPAGSKDAAAKDASEPPNLGASAEKAPPPSRSDPSDPGPPTLKRGKPADVNREHAADPPPDIAEAKAPPPMEERLPRAAEEPAEAGPPPAPSTRRSDEDYIPIVQKPDDPLIRKAADAALDFTETLPNYVCQEMMSRFQSEAHPANWQAIDIVTANLVYENGKEDYRNIAVNGKPKKSLEETGGAWSTGEFGTVLIDLFSPATSADFHYQRDSRAGGINAKMYDFAVTREHSHWSIHMASQTYMPPYKGSVWIDPQTARVLRIEMQAYGFPESFPTDHVESASDYQYIRLGDAKQYLLPVHAETLSCQRGTNYCSRNTIDFRNYHKYTGESSITFGGAK